MIMDSLYEEKRSIVIFEIFFRRVIEEILQTEETYVADLKLVVEVRDLVMQDVVACDYDVIVFNLFIEMPPPLCVGAAASQFEGKREHHLHKRGGHRGISQNVRSHTHPAILYI